MEADNVQSGKCGHKLDRTTALLHQLKKVVPTLTEVSSYYEKKILMKAMIEVILSKSDNYKLTIICNRDK